MSIVCCARWKRLVVTLSICIVTAGMYGVYYAAYSGLVAARVMATSMNLSDIGVRIVEFRIANHREPSGRKDLQLESGTTIDAVSGQPLVWASRLADTREPRPIVWQPRPYRTHPWPFGKMTRMALYSDRSVRDLPTEHPAR